MELSISELRSNNIVHIVIDGTAHFSVIREITETSVKLSDPKLGNIVMGREKFHEVFTGNVLVISGPQEINQTAEQTNSSTENLTTEEMESIKGQQLSVSSNMQLTAEEMQTIKGRANL
jgi:ABC-type bacteriocin/lantibiotic exporter with double-glycine peptidase domain